MTFVMDMGSSSTITAMCARCSAAGACETGAPAGSPRCAIFGASMPITGLLTPDQRHTSPRSLPCARFPAHKLRALIPGRPPRRLTRLEPPFWRLSTESTDSCFERSTTPSCSQSTGLSAWAADGSSSGGQNSKLLSALPRFGW